MKRLISIVAAVLVCTLVPAQSRHQFTFSMGVPAGGFSELDAYYDSSTSPDNTLSSLYENHSSASGNACLEAGYGYAVKPWLLVGLNAGVGFFETTTFRGYAYSQNESYSGYAYRISLMPMVKLEWLDVKWFHLFTQLALGACIKTGADNSVSLSPAGQFSPLTIAVGKDAFRFYAGYSLGTEYLFRIGISYNL